MKTIWIDIYHIPQFNFYLSLMKQLTAKYYVVRLTVLNRGRLVKIARNDLASLGLLASSDGEPGKVTVDVVGRHRMKRWSVILEANFLRILSLGWWRLRHHVDVCFTNGFHATLWSRVFGNPSYTFGDDPDTFDYKPKLRFASKVHFCLVDRAYLDEASASADNASSVRDLDPQVNVVRCLKEWASLAPSVFTPNPKALEKYGVRPKEYIFLREVSVGTVNYAGQAPQAILAVKEQIEALGLKVLFSLEEKNRRGEYPEDWILLQEPIEDIHSLMYYSAGLVSSGDSMAREAALLGIPAYYLGTRHSMPANLAAAKVAGLQNELTMPFSDWLNTLHGTPDELQQKQDDLRRKIDADFIDINAYMMGLVEKRNVKIVTK